MRKKQHVTHMTVIKKLGTACDTFNRLFTISPTHDAEKNGLNELSDIMKIVKPESVNQLSATLLNSISEVQMWQCPCIEKQHVKRL